MAKRKKLKWTTEFIAYKTKREAIERSKELEEKGYSVRIRKTKKYGYVISKRKK